MNFKYHVWIWMVLDPYNGSFWSFQFNINALAEFFTWKMLITNVSLSIAPGGCLLHEIMTHKTWRGHTFFRKLLHNLQITTELRPCSHRIPLWKDTQPDNSASWLPVSINHPNQHSQTCSNSPIKEVPSNGSRWDVSSPCTFAPVSSSDTCSGTYLSTVPRGQRCTANLSWKVWKIPWHTARYVIKPHDFSLHPRSLR